MALLKVLMFLLVSPDVSAEVGVKAIFGTIRIILPKNLPYSHALPAWLVFHRFSWSIHACREEALVPYASAATASLAGQATVVARIHMPRMIPVLVILQGMRTEQKRCLVLVKRLSLYAK